MGLCYSSFKFSVFFWCFFGFVCLEYAILPVPLDCLFLFAPSSLSNVYYKTRFSLANVYSKTHNWHAVTNGSGASFHYEGRFGGHRKTGKWTVIYLWVGVSILSFPTILIFAFGIVTTVRFFLFLFLLEVSVIIFCPKSNDL